MGYLQLIKQETNESPSKDVKELIKKHPLFNLNRKNINDNLLYDYSGDENKCSEPTDILSNEESKSIKSSVTLLGKFIFLRRVIAIVLSFF